MTEPFARSFGDLGFGAGGVWAGPLVSDAEAEELVRLAVELGIRYFDTGPTYAGGAAESRLSKALRRQDDVAVSTKVGTHLVRGKLVKDYAPGSLRSSLIDSLRRLDRDHVDLVLTHGPLKAEHVTPELMETLASFKEQGLTKAIGASCDGAVARAVVDSGVFDAVMMTLNVISPDKSHATAKYARAGGVSVIAKAPMGHGAFTPSVLVPRSRRQAWYLARLLRHYPGDLYRGMRVGGCVADATGDSPAVASLRYVLTLPYTDTAVVGTSSRAHLEEAVRAAARPLDPRSLDQVANCRRRARLGG